MAARTPRATAFRLVRGQRSLAFAAMMAGIAGLALFGVVLASALLARVASGYSGGVMLGAGAMALAWAILTSGRTERDRDAPPTGRRVATACRRTPMSTGRAPSDQPPFPAAPDHRSVPCRNSRHPGR
ncbi:MAG TPA: hypothetical protein VHT75_00695 [Acidimicrobiales bacterium]|nr:hypothetical protein [Acidimicrobiales bacterium]